MKGFFSKEVHNIPVILNKTTSGKFGEAVEIRRPRKVIRDLNFILGLPLALQWKKKKKSSKNRKVTASPRKADDRTPKVPFTSNNSSDLSYSRETVP